MEKYKNWKKLKNLAQRIVTKEKYKKVKLRDAIETQARNSRASTGQQRCSTFFQCRNLARDIRDFRDFTRLYANCLDIAVTMQEIQVSCTIVIHSEIHFNV